MYNIISLDSDLYLSLNNVFIPDHGYVVIDDIGSNGYILVILYCVILIDKALLQATGYHLVVPQWVF